MDNELLTLGPAGLIGCGTMGKCMLQKLRERGADVFVYDPFPAAMEYAVGQGAHAASSPQQVAKACKYILLSLPGPDQIEAAVLGPGGLLGALTKDHIVADTSTTAPRSTRSIAERVAETGAKYLDCPILGRPSAVGKWLLPVGGDEEALEKIRPILSAFAANAVPAGPSGAGNALKLLNQMMFSAINAVSAEAMAICENVGVDKKVFYETVAASGAATVSGLFKEVGRTIVEEGFKSPAFTVDLLIKDTMLALQMAKDARAPSLVAGTVQLYNELASANGYGREDTAALYKVFSGHFRKEQ